MSKNELRSSGKHRRCGFANGARELRAVDFTNGSAELPAIGSALAPGKVIRYNIGKQFSNRNERRTLIL